MNERDAAVAAIQSQFPRYHDTLKEALKVAFPVLSLGEAGDVWRVWGDLRAMYHTIKPADAARIDGELKRVLAVVGPAPVKEEPVAEEPEKEAPKPRRGRPKKVEA